MSAVEAAIPPGDEDRPLSSMSTRCPSRTTGTVASTPCPSTPRGVLSPTRLSPTPGMSPRTPSPTSLPQEHLGSGDRCGAFLSQDIAGWFHGKSHGKSYKHGRFGGTLILGNLHVVAPFFFLGLSLFFSR